MPCEGRGEGDVELGSLDGFSQAALLTDNECRIVSVNAAAERLMAFTPSRSAGLETQ